ncbi:MAG TPA: GAF domain-containing protein, partial [Candidatus Methylomirabilis sp.]
STLTYGAMAALALVGVAFLVARGAGRRVRRLQAAAAQVTRGNFASRLPAEAGDELGDLARSFNAMAESLARHDAEVQARTEEAERRRQEVEVFNAVIQAAHTSLNLRESLEAMLDSLMALFQFRSGAVRLLDAVTGALEMAAHRGLRPAYAANPVPLRAGEGHLGQTLQAGHPLLFNDPVDLAEFQDRVAEGVQVGGALFVPILAKGQPLGAIALLADRALNFTDAELNLLGSIGLEVGSAIQNARLFSQAQALLAEAQRHRARAEALAEIGRAVTATLEVDRVLDLLVERTCSVMGADAAGILRIVDGRLRYVRSWGLSAEHVRGISLGPGEGVGGAAALARAQVWTADVLADPRFTLSPGILRAHQEGIRAILASPILLGNDLYGIFSIHYRQPHAFASEEVGFAAAVAQQAAIALQNARLYADLQAAYQQLKTAQDQALQVEKLRALGEMAAGVAHDFNNLLAAILGRAQLLRVRIADPDARAGLGVIERAALDGAETVRRILGFARTRVPEQMETVEVEGVLHQVVEVTRPRWKDEAQARGAAIEVQLDLHPVPPVRGNAAELREVFVNLIFNAVDAMPTGGTITLGVHHETHNARGDGRGEEVAIFVRDTGTGMPEDVRRRVFDPFFTTKGHRGSGLGLSVAFGIVSRHGGTIAIDSREGVGTTVIVRLPVAAAAAAQAPEAAPPPTAPAHILVVDDEEMLADLLAEMLRLGGHTVDAMTDPHLALARLRTNSVDLLFTDLGMPDVSGWDVAAQARALHPDLPVILVTGWGHQIDPERLQASGVSGVVAKPYRMEDISHAVAAALKGRPPKASP